MKLSILILILVPIVVFTSITSYFVYEKNTVENVVNVPLMVKVNESFGLNADPDALKFGKLIPGSAGQRSIVLENNGTYPVKIHVQLFGEIAPWVQITQNNMKLSPGEKQQFNFTVHIPDGTEFGQYNGHAKVIFKKPFFS